MAPDEAGRPGDEDALVAHDWSGFAPAAAMARVSLRPTASIAAAAMLD
jgi:hypothetical protein